MLTDDLLELQRLDTTAGQLTHRRANLPERGTAAEAEAALAEHRRTASASTARAHELELAIDALERDGEALAAQRTRLEAQLRTITAPRQAEALMHELETIATRRDELDDQELAHLDEQSELADVLAGLAAAQPAVESAATESSAALSGAAAAIDDELAAIAASRDSVIAHLDAGVIERYERLRVAPRRRRRRQARGQPVRRLPPRPVHHRAGRGPRRRNRTAHRLPAVRSDARAVEKCSAGSSARPSSRSG